MTGKIVMQCLASKISPGLQIWWNIDFPSVVMKMIYYMLKQRGVRWDVIFYKFDFALTLCSKCGNSGIEAFLRDIK